MQIKKKEIGRIFEKLQLDVRSTKTPVWGLLFKGKDIESPLFTWQGYQTKSESQTESSHKRISETL